MIMIMIMGKRELLTWTQRHNVKFIHSRLNDIDDENNDNDINNDNDSDETIKLDYESSMLTH